MRWASYDQKPSWFNNAGLKPLYARRGASRVGAREDHHGTRQRYTVMTSVHSWHVRGCNEPPPCAVLFKGDTDRTPILRCVGTYIVGMEWLPGIVRATKAFRMYIGCIVRASARIGSYVHHVRRYLCFSRRVAGILAGLSAPQWCKLQQQEKGSYRTEDVLAYLNWALPDAASPQESCVVMLDWYSAHLSHDVQALLRNKGHVIVYHGGGTTGIEQINAARPFLVVV